MLLVLVTCIYLSIPLSIPGVGVIYRLFFFSGILPSLTDLSALSLYFLISNRVSCVVWVDFVYRVTTTEFVMVHLK